MWKVYGNYLETAEVDGTETTQAMGFTLSANTVIRGIRSWFVFYGSPTFTAFRMRLYEARGTGAGKLITTSTNTFLPADIYTDVYALKGIYFTFADYAFKADTTYYCLPYITGYTASNASHIAWVKAFPDPEYRTGLDLSYEGMHVMPYRFAVVGADL